MPLSENNILLNLLVEKVATIPLNTIEFNRLSITALQYLLSCTYEKEIAFVTPEYEVLRYSAILAAKQISDDAHKAIMKRLPTLEQMKNSLQVENKFITDHRRIAEELKPLIKFIDFKRIKDLSSVRGISIYKFNYVWDESACGSKLIVEDNGKIVHAPYGCGYQNVRAKAVLENEGGQPTGWILGSSGYCSNSGKDLYYCPMFYRDDSKITVHLDMNKRTCAFTVNGIKYREVSEWNNLPSKLYPVVSLMYSGRFRIQSHQEN
ncbi:hypothetical protein C1646_59110 [Rhizophagus diaphanus]|nr:hypothetical protein C1646_59110 [Rhizophagus diaphanus] [Rhizophagus sp. MUCL 43196]